MALLEKIQTNHSVGINISPNQGDLAFVPIDKVGTPGRLNLFVLKEYGYSTKDLPDERVLSHGFGTAIDGKRKSIVFIVTIDDGNTRENLQRNLLAALTEFRRWFAGKKLWIPLMGTGDGGLSLEESYLITARTLNTFQSTNFTDTLLILSIPEGEEGRNLLSKISSSSYSSQNDLHSLVKNYKTKFYLVGTFWGANNDQTARFIEKGLWEKGHEDETYDEIINGLNEDDVLIVKSSFHAHGISYLKVRAIGIVVENEKNGASVKVDWVITGLLEDFADLGHYRRTIMRPSNDDVVTILGRLNEDQLKRLIHPEKTKGFRESIAGIISDSDSGADYLSIDNDVKAFARVVAAKSFEPPLAIALFGKWGSGKSFFMRKLKEEIRSLSMNTKGGVYCEGVAQIHFNAWSYMDCNLWASIVTKLFEELQEYISENKKDDVERKVIEKELTQELSITKDELANLQSMKGAIEGQIKSLNDKKSKIGNQLAAKINQVNERTLWKVLDNIDQKFDFEARILASLEENASYIKTREQLKQLVPEKYWNNPEKALEIASDRVTFLKYFFSKKTLDKNVMWFVGILAIVAFAPLLLLFLETKIELSDFALPQVLLSVCAFAGAMWRQAENVYNKLQPIIGSFWKIKEEREKLVSEARAKFEREEKVLQLEIERNSAEVLQLEEQIQKAKTVKSDLEYRIQNAFATEALYTFIDKRSKTDEYKKHLGLISVIRRDFEILNNLFTDHQAESQKISSAKAFREKFKKPLERIVLYIDDLDRCPEENVVQVLEAVNLLMAFPLFVVVVGVDARWIKNALQKRHAIQFNQDINENTQALEASNYLEKIFQVAFHLKATSDDGVKHMIRSLAITQPSVLKVNTANAMGAKVLMDDEEEDDQSYSATDNDREYIFKPVKADPGPEALILEPKEVGFMEDLSELVGSNPRAIKRFVNTYRIVKAHQSLSPEANNDEQTACVLLLLAIPLGPFKGLLESIDALALKHNPPELISKYFLAGNVDPSATELYQLLLNKLTGKKITDTLRNLTCEMVADQFKLTGRFTFRNV